MLPATPRSVARAAAVAATLALLAPACDEDAPQPSPSMIAVVDDAGREIRLTRPARRIVSLVPSATETIVALGATERLIARTDYDRSAELASLPSLGGGLDPSVEALVELGPDLVLAWNPRDDAGLRARLEAAGIPVYSAAIQDTAALFATLRRLGILLGRESAADSLSRSLRDTLTAIAAESEGEPRPRVLFLLDEDPPRTAGPGTFVSDLIVIAGGEPAYPAIAGEWPVVALETVVADPPDVILVPVVGAEPPALARRVGWRGVPAVREGRVSGLPADLVTRPGPAIGRAARAVRDSLRAIAARTEAF